MTITRYAVTATLALSLALTACSRSVNPATGRAEYTTLSDGQAAKIGAQEHPKILEEFGGAYTERGIDQYVNSIGQRLAANSELAGQRFTFTVLDDPIVNAFALPGGYVYVSRGLLALAEDEAQLASVLGHEIGHVTGRHAAQRQTRSTIAGLGTLAAVLGAQALDLGPQATKSINELTNTAAKGSVASFSRSQELEADRLGVRYISRAGYDPYAGAEFLTALRSQEALSSRLKGKTDDPNSVDFFATHPATGARINESVAAVKAAGIPVNSGAPRNRDAYLRAIEGMVYGDNTDQGFVRGQNFYHIPLNFAVTAPASYRIVNTSNALIFKHRSAKNVGAKLTAGKRTTSDMLTYLRNGLKVSSGGQRLTISGMPAATITKELNKGLAGRLVAIDAGDKIYRFTFITPSRSASQNDRDFHALANSFRRLSGSDHALARPQTIRIHRVGYGETVESLAARTPFQTEQVQRFRVLNGLQPGEQLQPGQLVKLVQ